MLGVSPSLCAKEGMTLPLQTLINTKDHYLNLHNNLTLVYHAFPGNIPFSWRWYLKVVVWAFLANYSCFPGSLPVYMKYDVIKLLCVFSSCSSVFITRMLEPEPKRVGRKLLFLPYRAIVLNHFFAFQETFRMID